MRLVAGILVILSFCGAPAALAQSPDGQSLLTALLSLNPKRIGDQLRVLGFDFEKFFRNTLQLETKNCVYTYTVPVTKWSVPIPSSDLNLCTYLSIADSLSLDRSTNVVDIDFKSTVTGADLKVKLEWDPNHFGIWEAVKRARKIVEGELRPSDSPSFLGTITLNFEKGLALSELYIAGQSGLAPAGAELVTKAVMVFTPDPANPTGSTSVDILFYSNESTESIYHMLLVTNYNPFVIRKTHKIHLEGN